MCIKNVRNIHVFIIDYHSSMHLKYMKISKQIYMLIKFIWVKNVYIH